VKKIENSKIKTSRYMFFNFFLTSFWKKKGRATKWVFLHFVTQNWAWFWQVGDNAIHIYLAPDVRNSSGIVSEIVSPEVIGKLNFRDPL
jgi:hypothetical protein